MKKILLNVTFILFIFSQTAFAITIDFETLTGPSLFSSASPSPQTLNFSTGAGNVNFQGGVILTQTTNLPANQSSVYGTATSGNGLSNPLTITFENAVTNFYMDVYNGLTTDITYRVSDNNGNQSDFTLAPNLSGGTTYIGFSATGTIVTIESITAPTSSWDFFIDNITFNEPLPPDDSVPLPTTVVLLGTGLLSLAGSSRKKQLK